MTKKTATALFIGLSVGTAVLLAGCQLPNMSAQNTTSVTMEPTPTPASATDNSTTNGTTDTTIQPSPTIDSSTSVDQDLNSLDTLSKQSNPAVLGANSASNANLGVQ